MNKTLFILLYVILNLVQYLPKSGFAQNLVPNPSFEQNTGCPQGYFEINLCNDWYNPTGGSSDYFHTCSPTINSPFVNIPSNSDGYQLAQDGNAYVGLSPYSVQINIPDYTEYIQCQLSQPLISGKEYNVKFYVSLGDSISNHAIKNMGTWFSTTAYINMSNANTISATPQVVANYFLTDYTNWMEVNGTFIAVGGEEYLTIGSFVQSELNIDTLFLQSSIAPFPYAYYYIDNVSVTEVKEPITPIEPCINNSLLVSNIFTPNNDKVNDEFSINLNCETEISLIIYNRWGNQIYNIKELDNVSWDGGNQNTGTYYYIISYLNENNEKIIKKGFVQLLR